MNERTSVEARSLNSELSNSPLALVLGQFAILHCLAVPILGAAVRICSKIRIETRDPHNILITVWNKAGEWKSKIQYSIVMLTRIYVLVDGSKK